MVALKNVLRLFSLCLLLPVNHGYISSISPRYGSLAGGTVITITGGGLISNDTVSTDMYIGQLPCKAQWYRSNNERVYCETLPLHASIGSNYQFLYTNWITASVTTCPDCTFTYDNDHTPTVTKWTQTISSSSMFFFEGVFNAKFAEQYTIKTDNGGRCTGLMKSDDAVLEFGLNLYEQVISDYWDENAKLVCFMPKLEAGRHNFSVHVSHFTSSVIQSPGDSFTLPFRDRNHGLGNAKFEEATSRGHHQPSKDQVRSAGRDTEPYLLLVVPQIQSLSTQSSGSLGRQSLVVTGSGFAASTESRGCEANTVTLSGVPCQVTHCTDGELRCDVGSSSDNRHLTQRPYPSTFGLSRTTYSGTFRTLYSKETMTGGLLSSMHNHRYGYGSQSEKLTGFFVAPHTAWYSFHVVSSDACQLSVSRTNVLNDDVVSATCTRSDYFDYFAHEQQHSNKIFLLAGSRHAFEAKHWDLRGIKQFKAAVQIHDPVYQKTDDEARYHSPTERQRIHVNLQMQPEIVDITIKDYDPVTSFIQFSRTFTATDQLYNYTSGEYYAKSVKRQRTSDPIYVNDDNGTATMLSVLKSNYANSIRCNEITVSRSGGDNTGWVTFTITTGCLPRAKNNNLPSYIRTNGLRSAPWAGPTPVEPSFPDVEVLGRVMAGGDAAVEDPGSGSHSEMDGSGSESGSDLGQEECASFPNDFYTACPLNITALVANDVEGGVAGCKTQACAVFVQSLNDSTTVDCVSTTFNVTVDQLKTLLANVSSSCTTETTTVATSTTAIPPSVAIKTIQWYTTKMAGYFTVGFDNIDRVSISISDCYSWRSNNIKKKLMYLHHVAPNVGVSVSGRADRGDFSIEVEFHGSHGHNFPEFIVDSSTIRPMDIETRGRIVVKTSTIVNGSETDLFYDPIPDYMFEVDTGEQPNAVVTVNDINAECATARPFTSRYFDIYVPTLDALKARTQKILNHNCGFAYDATTPTVYNTTSLSDDVGNNSVIAGDTILIVGTGFRSSDLTTVQVEVGGAACEVEGHNDTAIVCVVSEMKTGNYHPLVICSDVGQAQIDDSARSVWYRLEIDDISPSVGSVRGGSVLIVRGTGFSTVGPENQIAVGSASCSIITATFNEISCYIPVAPIKHIDAHCTNGGSQCGDGKNSSSSTPTATIVAGAWCEPNGKFCFDWKPSEEDDEEDKITIRLNASAIGVANGYVALGFAAFPFSMRNADVAMCSNTPTPTVSDRYHSSDYSEGRNNMNQVDTVNDLSLISLTAVGNDFLTCTFTRPVVARGGDTQDRSIPSGLVDFIWAMDSDSTTEAPNYHGIGRGGGDAVFVTMPQSNDTLSSASTMSVDVSARVFDYEGSEESFFRGVVTESDFVEETFDGVWGNWGTEISDTLRDTKYYGYSCPSCVGRTVIEHKRWGSSVNGKYVRDTLSVGNSDGAWSDWTDSSWNREDSEVESLDGAWGSWNNGSWGEWETASEEFTYDWNLTPIITQITPSAMSSAQTTRVTIRGDFANVSMSNNGCKATMRFVSPSGLFRECQGLTLDGDTASCLLVRGKSFPEHEQRKMFPWLKLCHNIGIEVVAHPDPNCCSSAPYNGRVDLALRVDSTTPKGGSLAGGTIVTVNGAGFGPLDGKIVRSALTYNYFDSINVVNISTDHKILKCEILEANYTTILCRAPLLQAAESDVHRLSFVGRYIYSGDVGRNGRVSVSVNDIPAAGCGTDPNQWAPNATSTNSKEDDEVDVIIDSRSIDSDTLGASCETVLTDGGVDVWDYRYSYRTSDADLEEGIVVNVKAKHSAHIVLSPINTVIGSQRGVEMYEIVLGGWSNTKSSISRTKFGTTQYSIKSEFLLNRHKGSDFWVRVVNGSVTVGSGCAIGRGEFMSWTDPLPIPSLQHFGVATVDTKGFWVHCSNPDDMPLGTCGTEAVSNFTTVLPTTPFYNLTYTDADSTFLCEFDYNQESTPTLTSVSPLRVTNQTMLTIQGTLFDSEPVIHIGLFVCEVQEWNATEVQCLAPAMTAGRYHVRVLIGLYGYAAHPSDHDDEFVVTSELTLTSIEPRNGSMYGGVMVTLTGRGFSTEIANNNVTIDGLLAHVITATHDTLVVVAPKATQVGLCVEQYSPLFLTESASNSLSPTSQSHSHVLGGVTYYMPTGFTPSHHGDADCGSTLNSTMNNATMSNQTTVPLDGERIVVGVRTEEEPRRHSYGQLHPTAHRYTEGTVDVTDVLETEMVDYYRTRNRPLVDNNTGTVVLPGVYYASSGFCEDEQACRFMYEETLTPVAHTLEPALGQFGDVITISGSHFGDLVDGLGVLIGGEDCTVLTVLDTTLTCRVGATPAGVHEVYLTVRALGTADATNITFESVLTVDGLSEISGSYGGGHIITITGKGFGGGDVNNNRHRRDGAWGGWIIYEYLESEAGPDNLGTDIKICDRPCTVLESSYGEVVCQTPQVNSVASANEFGALESAVLLGSVFSSVVSGTRTHGAAFDGDYETAFVDAEAGCSTGLDLGEQGTSVLTKVRWFPEHQKAELMIGGQFQVSVDGFSWNTVHTVSDSHDGWNVIRLDVDEPVRHIRFFNENNSCAIAFLEFSGAPASATGACSIRVDIQQPISHAALGPATTDSSVVYSQLFSNVVYDYMISDTPTVTNVSPIYGSSLGGTLVNLTGTGLPTSVSTAAVKLNGRDCDVQFVAGDGTMVSCVTSARTSFQPPSIEVWDTSGVGIAVLNDTVIFRYLDRWSEVNTWLNDEPPLANDTVVIPQDQAILIDVPLPRLFLVLVQGFLMFDPEATVPLNLNATYILVYGGTLQVGTREQPFTGEAAITLHGDRYSTVEFPDFGAKVLAVADRGGLSQSSFANGEGFEVPLSQRGVLDIHGSPRVTTWTTLAASAAAGDTILNFSEPVDFKRGEKLVVTGEITKINAGDTNDLMADMPPPCMPDLFPPPSETSAEEIEVLELIDDHTVRLATPLKYKHVSEIVTTPNGATVDMRAQVGLLTRNVVLQGDDSSPDQLFGAHTIAVHGGHFRVENTEVRNCGQASNLGRYCLHFHKAGFQPPTQSYIHANSIHHGFQRATTIHGTTHAKVSNNVAYKIMGHNYFVEDGDEEYVVLEKNLGIETIISPYSLFSDCQAATFWTASPKNIWRDNVAANSHGHGFWFELDAGAAGDFTHHPTIEVSGNNFHDNNLRGWFIAPQYTPTTPQYFRNNTYSRNQLDGVFYGVGGDTHHIGDKFMSNGGTADMMWWFFPSRESSRWIPNLKDVSFVGGNWGVAGPPRHNGGAALFAPNMEFFLVDGAEFVNYSTAVPAISQCFDCCNYRARQGAFTTRFAGLSFVDTNQRTTFPCPAKQIYFDMDGSLTGEASSTVTAYHRFNEWEECPRANITFGQGLVCNSSVRVRKLSIPSFSGVPKSTEPRSILTKNLYVKKSRMVKPQGFRASFQFVGQLSQPSSFEKKQALDDIAVFLGLNPRDVVEDHHAWVNANATELNVLVGGFRDEVSHLDPQRRQRAVAAHAFLCNDNAKVEQVGQWTTCGPTCVCPQSVVRYGYGDDWAEVNMSVFGSDSVTCGDQSAFSSLSFRHPAAIEYASCQCLQLNTLENNRVGFNFSGIATVYNPKPLTCSNVIDEIDECKYDDDIVARYSGAPTLSPTYSPLEQSTNQTPSPTPLPTPNGVGLGALPCLPPSGGQTPLHGVPAGYTLCAAEGGNCKCVGKVRYGANEQFAYQQSTGSIACTNGVFGDPIRGTSKSCYCPVCESVYFPPEDFFAVGLGTVCIGTDGWESEGWPKQFARSADTCKHFQSVSEVYDPIDYDTWTRESVQDAADVTPWEGVAVGCSEWVCNVLGFGEGCEDWSCYSASAPQADLPDLPTDHPASRFDGTWFIGEDPDRDQSCVQQVCHDKQLLDGELGMFIAGCWRFRCVAAMLSDQCVEFYEVVNTEAACAQKCKETEGCTATKFFYPMENGDVSCELYNIPYLEIIVQADETMYPCLIQRIYPEDPLIIDGVPIDRSCSSNGANSENTCLSALPTVDEFGGINMQSYEAVGEWFDNKVGLDHVEYGPGKLQTSRSMQGFDWEGWSVPLVTHHDYIIDVQGHIDFQQFAARWSEPFILTNPAPPADQWVPSDARFSGAADFKPITDGSVLLSFPYVDYRYRFRVDVPGFPDVPWYDDISDRCERNQCEVDLPLAGRTRGAITRFDNHGVGFIDREDDSLTTTGTRGLWQVAINPWAGVDTCAERPTPFNTSLATKALQCSPYMCDSGLRKDLGAARLWSDLSLWQELSFAPKYTGGAHAEGTKPEMFAIVEIPAGYHVMLDESPPLLTKLVVYGKLEFMDEKDIHLNTESVVVFGAFDIGTPEKPYKHKATVTVHGNRTSTTVVVSDQHFLGNKVIANFGNMSLYGDTPTVTHMKLAQTVNVGATTMRLMQPVDWIVNDTLVLAGTDFVNTPYSGLTGTYDGYNFVRLPGPSELPTSSEDLTITDVSNDGLTVTFSPPLKYRHFAGSVNIGLDPEDFTMTVNGEQVSLSVRGISQAHVGWESVNTTELALFAGDPCSVQAGNRNDVEGKVAVVTRDLDCDVNQHAKVLAVAGAKAMIVIELDTEPVLLRDTGVALPTVILGQADGALITDELLDSKTVTLNTGGKVVELRATVGNLRRNIVFKSELQRGCTRRQHELNEQHFEQFCKDRFDSFHECDAQNPYPHKCYFMKGYGAHFLTTEWNYGSEDDYLSAKENNSPLPRTSIGQIQASGVRFQDFGKLGMEHRSFHINYLHEYTAERVANAIERCVFVNSWNGGIIVGQAPAMTIANNIVHKTLGVSMTTGDPLLLLNWEARRPDGFGSQRRRSMSKTLNAFARSVGGGEHIVDDNLITASFEYPAGELNEPLQQMWHSGMLLRQSMLSMKRNIVSGAAHGGLTWVMQDALNMGNDTHTTMDNEAYASLYGAVVRGNKRFPTQLYRFKSWRNGESGVVAFDEVQNLRFSNVVVADNKYGVSVQFTASASLEMIRCVVIGNSEVSAGSIRTCPAAVGVELPIYTTKGGPRCDAMFGPCETCAVEGSTMRERFGNTNTGLTEEFYIEGTAFAHFGTGACLNAKGIHLNPTSPDYSPDVFLDRLRWHSSVAKDRRFRLGDTDGTHPGCGNGASCDALNFLKVHDGDGSTIGDFWTDGIKVDNVRNIILYSSNFPQILREDKCRAHADSMSIVCTDYPLTTVSIDVPPQCPDGCPPVASVTVHKYNMQPNVSLHQDQSTKLASYFTVGAFKQGCSCQKHIMGGSFPVEPNLMYDFDLPVVDDLNLPGQYLPQFMPPNTRIVYHSADPQECILVRLFMQKSKPVTVLFNSREITSEGTRPTLTSSGGSSAMYPKLRRLYVTLCGSRGGAAEYVFRVEERVQVTVAISLDFSDFYAEVLPDLENTPLKGRVAAFQRTLGLDRMVNNFASLLGIASENVKVACVHAVGEPCIPLELMLATGGYNPDGRRRSDGDESAHLHRRAVGNSNTNVVLEVTPPNPVNQTGNQTTYQENVDFLNAVQDSIENATSSAMNDLVNETIGDALNQSIGVTEKAGVLAEFGSGAVEQGAVSFPTTPPTFAPTTSSPTTSPTISPTTSCKFPKFTRIVIKDPANRSTSIHRPEDVYLNNGCTDITCIRIQTSCKNPLGLGDAFGNLVVTGWAAQSQRGGDIVTHESGQTDACSRNRKLVSITLTYVSKALTAHRQGNKASVIGTAYSNMDVDFETQTDDGAMVEVVEGVSPGDSVTVNGCAFETVYEGTPVSLAGFPVITIELDADVSMISTTQVCQGVIEAIGIDKVVMETTDCIVSAGSVIATIVFLPESGITTTTSAEMIANDLRQDHSPGYPASITVFGIRVHILGVETTVLKEPAATTKRTKVPITTTVNPWISLNDTNDTNDTRTVVSVANNITQSLLITGCVLLALVFIVTMSLVLVRWRKYAEISHTPVVPTDSDVVARKTRSPDEFMWDDDYNVDEVNHDEQMANHEQQMANHEQMANHLKVYGDVDSAMIQEPNEADYERSVKSRQMSTFSAGYLNDLMRKRKDSEGYISQFGSMPGSRRGTMQMQVGTDLDLSGRRGTMQMGSPMHVQQMGSPMQMQKGSIDLDYDDDIKDMMDMDGYGDVDVEPRFATPRNPNRDEYIEQIASMHGSRRGTMQSMQNGRFDLDFDDDISDMMDMDGMDNGYVEPKPLTLAPTPPPPPPPLQDRRLTFADEPLQSRLGLNVLDCGGLEQRISERSQNWEEIEEPQSESTATEYADPIHQKMNLVYLDEASTQGSLRGADEMISPDLELMSQEMFRPGVMTPTVPSIEDSHGVENNDLQVNSMYVGAVGSKQIQGSYVDSDANSLLELVSLQHSRKNSMLHDSLHSES